MFKLILGLVILGSLIFSFSTSSNVFLFSMLNFPFEQIGNLLRELSLSGTIGNIFSWIIYFGICLLPLVLFFYMRKKHSIKKCDYLLIVLTFVMFYVLYYMINPGFLSGMFSTVIQMKKPALGSVVYSIILGYIILKSLTFIKVADSTKLFKYFKLLLKVMILLCTFTIFGTLLQQYLISKNAADNSNTQFIFFIAYINNIIPYIFNILILFQLIELCDDIKFNQVSEKTIVLLDKISKLCILALICIVISQITYQLLQAICITTIDSIHASVHLPITSIILVLAALLFTNYMKEVKKLKDENDLFI